MKLKEENIKWIQEQCAMRCEQIGIQECPTLIFRRQDVLSKPQTVGRRNTSRYLGVCYRKHNLIFINIKSKYIKRLKGKGFGCAEETLIHELVHLRWDYIQHGRMFQKRIKDIFNGKWYPVKPGLELE